MFDLSNFYIFYHTVSFTTNLSFQHIYIYKSSSLSDSIDFLDSLSLFLSFSLIHTQTNTHTHTIRPNRPTFPAIHIGNIRCPKRTLVQKAKAATQKRRNLDWSTFFFQKFIFLWMYLVIKLSLKNFWKKFFFDYYFICHETSVTRNCLLSQSGTLFSHVWRRGRLALDPLQK